DLVGGDGGGCCQVTQLAMGDQPGGIALSRDETILFWTNAVSCGLGCGQVMSLSLFDPMPMPVGVADMQDGPREIAVTDRPSIYWTLDSETIMGLTPQVSQPTTFVMPGFGIVRGMWQLGTRLYFGGDHTAGTTAQNGVFSFSDGAPNMPTFD